MVVGFFQNEERRLKNHLNTMQITKGQILKIKGGTGERKVLAILDDVACLSWPDNFELAGDWSTFKEIEKLFDIPVEKWIPIIGEEYYWINSMLEIDDYSFQDDEADLKYIKCFNFFKTSWEAQEAANKIKNLLKSLKK